MVERAVSARGIRLRSTTYQFEAAQGVNPGALHLRNGICDVVGLEVYPTTGVGNEVRFESRLGGIQGSELDAVIRRQAADKHVGNSLVLEPFAQSRGFAMAVVEEAAVAVDADVGALGKDPGDAFALQRGREFCAFGVMHAMHWPKRLRQAIQVNLLKDRPPGMARRETAVICRMPILGGHHEREDRLQPVDNGDDFVAVRHRQGATGKEVVLNVYQY